MAARGIACCSKCGTSVRIVIRCRRLLNPTFRKNLPLAHGRGIYFMKTLMDEVSFEEGGAVVMMRKKSNADSAEQRK